jgi:hypothetical protein
MSDELAIIVFDSSANWRRYPGCCENELHALAASAPIQLPADYLAFLRLSNGGEGPLGISPGWFIVWPASEVLKWNQANERDKYYRDLFLFGQCDGNLFGFDLTRQYPWPLVALDYLDSKRECMDQLGPNFIAFCQSMGRPWQDGVKLMSGR